MVSLRYFLRFKDEAWTEVGALVQSSNTTPLNVNLCSTSWMSTMNTASFILRYNGRNEYQALVVKLIKAQTEKTEVLCRITDDNGVVFFYGLVDLNKLELTSAKIPQSISISANDHMKKLDSKIGENAIFKVGTPMRDVIDWLVINGGLGVVDKDGNKTAPVEYFDGSDTIKLESPVVFEADSDEKHLDVMNKLLQELGGYALVSHPSDQKFHVKKIAKTSGAEEDGEDLETVHYMVSSKLKSGSSLFSNDGVVVKYKNVKTSGQELVYMQDISLSDGVLLDPNASYDDEGFRIPNDKDGTANIPLGDVVPVGGYFPLDGDITKTTQEYDSSLFDYTLQQKKSRKANEELGIYYVDPDSVEIKILATDKNGSELKSTWYENVAFHSEEGGFDYPEGGEFHPKKAWQVFRNKLPQCVNVQSFIIEGKAVFSDREYSLVMPMGAKDPYEYSSKYISTSKTASDLATLLTNLKKHGGDTSSWTAPWDSYGLGQEVYVEHPSATKVKAIIVRKTMRVIGNKLWCEYVAVHNGNWEASREYTFSKADVSAPSYDPYVQAVMGGFVGTRNDFEVANVTLVQYAVIPSADNFGGGDEYGDDEGSYGFTSDSAYGEDYDWTEGQIDTTTLEPGDYIWMRTSTDGGKTWVYTRLTGSDGRMFNLKVSRNTYKINKRAMPGQNNPEITVSVEITGYKGTAKVSCPTDQSLLDKKGVLTIPYNTNYQSIIIIASLKDAETQVVEINGIDVTEYGMYFGPNDGDSESFEGMLIVDGDSYYNTSDHVPMYRKDGVWVKGTEENIGNRLVFEKLLSVCQRDLLSDHVDAGTEVSGEYGYFYNLITRLLIVSRVVSNDFVEGESGFRLDGDTGTMEAVDAYLSGSISVDHAFVSKGVFRTDRFYPEIF